MEPLHRARLELSYTKTLRAKAENRMRAKLAGLDARIVQKQLKVYELELIVE